MAFDDQAVVREQYASEANLRARKALWEEAEGSDAKRDPLADDRGVAAAPRARGRRR